VVFTAACSIIHDKMPSSFIVEFTFEKRLYDGFVRNVAGDGSCFWHALDYAVGRGVQMLKMETARAMQVSRERHDALWGDFQNYLKHALQVPETLQGYALLDTTRTEDDPVELIRRPHQYAEEWMFPFVCAALKRDLAVVCHQGAGGGYRAYTPAPRMYPTRAPIFVYKDNQLAHYRAVDAEPE